MVLCGAAVAGLASHGLARSHGYPDIEEPVLVGRLEELAAGQMRAMAREPVVFDALARHNEISQSYNAAFIARLDGDWRRELYTEDHRTLIPAVMSSPASHYLGAVERLSDGLYTELMLIDARALNVALSRLIASYWHGERPRWQESFLAGPQGLHIGPDEYIDATGVWQRQVAITITDRALNPVGVLCAGVALDKV